LDDKDTESIIHTLGAYFADIKDENKDFISKILPFKDKRGDTTVWDIITRPFSFEDEPDISKLQVIKNDLMDITAYLYLPSTGLRSETFRIFKDIDFDNKGFYCKLNDVADKFKEYKERA